MGMSNKDIRMAARRERRGRNGKHGKGEHVRRTASAKVLQQEAELRANSCMKHYRPLSDGEQLSLDTLYPMDEAHAGLE